MSSEPHAERDALEVLAEEFLQHLRDGHTPTVQEYAQRYPQLADDIRELFPTMASMERLKYRKEHESGQTAGGRPIERLGDFRILREIGRGGMGIVYEAEQESLRRRVAIKVLPRHALLTAGPLKKFHREARIAAALHHTNIVSVFGVGHHEGLHYYVMQFIPGVGLDRVIRRLSGARPAQDAAETRAAPADETEAQPTPELDRIVESFFHPPAPRAARALPPVAPPAAATRQQPQPTTAVVAPPIVRAPVVLPPAPPRMSSPPVFSAGALRSGAGHFETVARLGVQAAHALHYAHTQGTVHCDIKPANLLLDAHGVVWITDFGVAKAMQAETVTQTSDVAGTLMYIAPERFHGDTDPRSDIYSLGLTLYELLILRPAFAAADRQTLVRRILDGTPPQPPRKLDPRIPRDLETVILKATARDPAHRYATAEELAQDLERFLDDRPVRARRITPVERAVRWCRRNPVMAGLTAAVVALSIAVTSFALVGYVQSQRAAALVRQVLALETRQRKQSEATSQLAMSVLDRIYAASGPNPAALPSSLVVQGADGKPITVPVTPALSKEAAGVLENLLVFYDRLGTQPGADDPALRQAAEANRRAAQIHVQLGQLDKARAACQRALDAYRTLQARQPQSESLCDELAATCIDQGNLRRGSSVPEESLADYHAARELLEPLVTHGTATAETRYQLARAYYQIGTLGRHPLAADEPPDPPPGADGGPPENWFGPPPKPPREHGPHPHRPQFAHDWVQADMETHLSQAIDLLEPLCREHPQEGRYRRLLACCYRDLPSRRTKQFRFRETIARSITMLEQLVQDFPDEPEYRLELATAYARRAESGPPPASKDLAQAEPYFQKALAIHQRLVAEYPTMPSYATGLVETLCQQARAQQDAGHSSEAQSAWNRALGLVSDLRQRFPDDPTYRLDAALIDSELADNYREQRQWAAARRVLEDGRAQLAALPATQRGLPHVRGLQASLIHTLADTLEDAGQRDEAQRLRQQETDAPPFHPRPLPE